MTAHNIVLVPNHNVMPEVVAKESEEISLMLVEIARRIKSYQRDDSLVDY